MLITGTPANLRQGSGTWAGIAALQQALERRGHEVELIAPATAPPSLTRRLLFNLRARRRLRGTRSAVVGFDLDGLWVPGAIASIKGVIAEEMRFERGATRLRLWAASRLEGWRVRRAPLVLATSACAAAALECCYRAAPARIRVVPELLDVGAWQADLAALERPPHAGCVVLCVAHLYPRKDVATLLRALALLPERVRVRVAGDGPERARLEALARRLRLGARAWFGGHVSDAGRLREYRNADLFALPSRQEGFGIVLLEAMASGLPIVAARAAAIPEVVPDPGCALLFPPGDERALAAHILRLAESAPLRAQLAAAGLARVLHFDAPRVAAAFLDAVADKRTG